MDIVVIADGLSDRVNIDVGEILNSFQEAIQSSEMSILDLPCDFFQLRVEIFQRLISQNSPEMNTI